MKTTTPQTIHLKDYSKPDFQISDIHLTFELDDTQTQVRAEMQVSSQTEAKDLFLNGEELTLKSVELNGETLPADRYELMEEGLKVKDVPRGEFTLTIENDINPRANKALEGLYKSGNIFCTQNEPEGFRRITYYLDRPDVMARFTTKIVADKAQNPILLSNGNPIDSGELEDGRHWVEWRDPFPKPSYLYALVAGDLAVTKDTFKTMSGREIKLELYVDKGNEDKCDHAMESLKKAMKWDEERFGREYDLDIYMIVAVESFNMGAMENKGLNIFNSSCVLARPETATDQNFEVIEGVIGHEYFHNWSGNRVTCRDWFQLTLKEGLTVFRDQEFSSDMNSRTVKRIEDAERLRQYQFAEDAGPTAHPIKPDSYMEINNFYTLTVYEKGAEVIRMIHTMLGEEGFRKGLDKYFELYDGQAVTTEDFLHAMSVANNNFDFEQFKRWYFQAGTPTVSAHADYDESAQTLTLTLSQFCPPTPGQEHKKPFHMPIKLGLVSPEGEDYPLVLEDDSAQPSIGESVIHLRDEEETFVFQDIPERPRLSLNRGFSAPIKVEEQDKKSDLIFLMAQDNDEFNRYEAAQSLANREVQRMLKLRHDGRSWEEIAEAFESKDYLGAYRALLLDGDLDPSIKSMMLSMPSESIIQQGHNPVDHQSIFEARETLMRILGKHFENEFKSLYEQNHESGEYKLDPISIGKRSLKMTCLSFLAVLGKDNHFDRLKEQQEKATNMTDEFSALSLLCRYSNAHQRNAIDAFYNKWKKDTLVMQKWLSAQAASPMEDTFDRVQELEKDEIYDINVPNLVRSLLGPFARNTYQFHHSTGRGYKFLADKISQLDEINPQVASALAGAFRDYKRLAPKKKELMGEQLQRLKTKEGLSKNTYEIVTKILGSTH